MTSWCRLWHDMPTDPKFRSIARASRQPLANVVAVYVFMMADASANAAERGRTHASDETIASALDLDDEAVAAIREAMQSRVLNGDSLSGWEKRQPKREDNSAERAKIWRELKKAEAEIERLRTQANAQERPDTEPDTETEKKDDSAADAASSSRYAFEHGVIRLNSKDLEKWRDAYPLLHLEAELYQLSEWAGRDHPKNWFHAVSAALAKRNRQQAAALEKARAEGAARGSPKRNLTDAAIDINRWMSPDAEPDTSRDQYALPSPDRW